MPPNVLLFLADDQTWFDSGAYGNDDVSTPNIDRLAQEGMRFTHAFTATAMCSPARQQIYTGLYPVRSGAYPNHSGVREGTRSLVHHFEERGYRVGLTGKEHFGPETSFPFERVRSASSLGQRVDLDAARRFISRDPRQPFFLVVASNSPHSPWTEGDPSRFDPASIAVPDYLIDTTETRSALVAYYAEITHLDAQLGALLRSIEASGQTRNTIVIYSSEQGASLPFAKWTLYDAGVRTALLVRWPERVSGDRVSEALVQTVDIFPTLVEATGGHPVSTDGRSFLDVLESRRTVHREYVFGVQTTRGIIHGPDYPIRAIRSARYKLILNLLPEQRFASAITRPPRDAILRSWQRPAPERAQSYVERPEVEFYDVVSDPAETTNLAQEPRFAESIVAHRAELDRWMASNGDLGLATECSSTDHMNPRILERLRARFGPDVIGPRSACECRLTGTCSSLTQEAR